MIPIDAAAFLQKIHIKILLKQTLVKKVQLSRKLFSAFALRGCGKAHRVVPPSAYRAPLACEHRA